MEAERVFRSFKNNQIDCMRYIDISPLPINSCNNTIYCLGKWSTLDILANLFNLKYSHNIDTSVIINIKCNK